MITSNLKISKLLREYPGSLEILLKASPHFAKLQNKLLRKTLAGRVTVEQAASIAGIELNDLLRELNETSAAAEDSKAGNNDDSKLIKEKKEQTSYARRNFDDFVSYRRSYLDVRPIINAGKDPLKDILDKVRTIKLDEVLVIINSFEPVPLYSLLGAKGFRYFTEKIDDAYKVYFYKKDGAVEGAEELPDNREKLPGNITKQIEFENTIEIDVHDLQPPEPMMKILENLQRIDERSVMIVHHHREPHLLYPILDERGYKAVCNKIGEDSFKILITKKTR